MPKSAIIRLIIFFATFAFIAGGTYLMIRYAEGYRPTRQGVIKGTGLLSANSFPNGAAVYINDRLTTATDNTLNLDPGIYDIAIKKDGYHTWEKKLTIQEQLVAQTNAQLFPASPSLDPLTFTGAINPVPAPDGSKIVFTVASASATAANGLYVEDLNASPLAFNKAAKQIARTTSDYDYTTAVYTWSPDGSQILVGFKNGAHLLLSPSTFTDVSALQDVTVTLPQTFQDWEAQLAREEHAELTKLPDFVAGIATQSATNLYVSPDGTKLLYQATASATIPDNLIPSLPASSTQTQSRTISLGNWYVYDMKEDRNFLISASTLPSPLPLASAKPKAGSVPAAVTIPLTKVMLLDNIKLPIPAELAASPSAFRRLQNGYTYNESITLFNAQYSSIFVDHVQWYPDSAHIVLTTDSGIDILDYDGTNRVTVYGGPFDHSFVYPWPDGSSIVTRIQFSPDTIPNLYTIKLK